MSNLLSGTIKDFTSVKYLTIQSPNILKITDIPEVPMIFRKDVTLLTFTVFAFPLSDHFTLGFVISKNNHLFQVQNKHKKLLLSGICSKSLSKQNILFFL